MFDYFMSVFQDMPRQNVINIVGPVPKRNAASFSSVQTCLCLLTQVLQTHVETSTYQDVQNLELFSHAWNHMKEMVYDCKWP